jgi:peptidoglycan hydrolase-like protein with peptidoglycan-binding domain
MFRRNKMNRPYTGYDKTASGKRAGFEKLVDLLEVHFGLWNNGTFGVRNKRGKSTPSVHATGRAGDLSWRGAPYRGSGNYHDAVRMMDFLAEYADVLDIEAIYDYYPQPWGRGWQCDRNAWRVYDNKAFSGAPGGDWVHVEIGNKYADNPNYYEQIFEDILGKAPVVVKSAVKTESAPAGKSPWLQVGSRGDQVKKVQEVVGAEPVDGVFGPKTEAAVKAWQADNDLHVDGIVGPSTWKQMNSSPTPAPAPAATPAPAPQAPQTAPVAPQSHPYPGEVIKFRSDNKEAVKLVQAKVGTKVDGDFGPATRQKVRDWQSANGLRADGLVGPKTWKAMFG